MGHKAYDEGNAHFKMISANLHFLLTLVLKEAAPDASVLCVGVGTGADIIDLAKAYPEWRFTGIDPSASMLDGCREKLQSERLSDRCELFQGYLSEFRSEQKFDVVLCLFVMHFIKDMGERNGMYQDMCRYLKPGGFVVDAEISTDLKSDLFPSSLENWKSLHRLGGAKEENLASMDKTLTEVLAVLPPEKIASMIEHNGLGKAVQFFQSFLIRGWYARKPG